MRLHWLRKHSKGMAGAFLALTAVSLSLYILARVALEDFEQSPPSSVPASFNGSVVLTMGADGRTRVWDGERILATIAGHDAPLLSADLLSHGRVVLTTDASGAVRLTRLDVATSVQAPDLTRTLSEKIWRPYGAPLAHSALWIVAQVAPLEVARTRIGGRGRAFRDCADCPEVIEIQPGMVFKGGRLHEA